MSTTIKLPQEFLLDEVLDNKEVVIEDNIVDVGRWTISHELVFRHEGNVYITYYSVGATEQQDERPWEYDEAEIECFLAREVPVFVWRRVPDAA